MLQLKSVGWKERKSWSVSSTYVEVMWFREEKMRVLRGVVYMPKSKGPRSEPWGHRRRMCTRNTSHFHIKFVRKERDDRYDLSLIRYSMVRSVV